MLSPHELLPDQEANRTVAPITRLVPLAVQHGG